MSIGWDEAREAKLRELDAAGCSAAVIADRLGGRVTRSAVIGKLNRMNGSRSAPRTPTQCRPSHPGSPWQPDKLALFHKLYAQKLTDGDIAAEMGPPFTRTSVQSKRNYLKLPAHVPPVTSSLRSFVMARKPIIVAPSVQCEPQPIGLTIHELRASSCRWPIGDPGNLDTFRYCGAKRTDERRATAASVPGSGSPYCPGHHRLAYNKAGG